MLFWLKADWPHTVASVQECEVVYWQYTGLHWERAICVKFKFWHPRPPRKPHFCRQMKQFSTQLISFWRHVILIELRTSRFTGTKNKNKKNRTLGGFVRTPSGSATGRIFLRRYQKIKLKYRHAQWNIQLQ